MNPPNDSGVDWSGYAVLTAFAAVLVAWVKRVNPLVPVRYCVAVVFDPVVSKHMAPVHTRFDRLEGKVDKVCRVIDKLPGSNEAHALVKEEDERWK